MVGDEVEILGKEVVDQNLLFVTGEDTESFASSLQVSNEFLAFDVERLFGVHQSFVDLDDMLRDFSQLIVGKIFLHLGINRLVAVRSLGKFAQLVDGAPQSASKLVECKEHHQREE